MAARQAASTARAGARKDGGPTRSCGDRIDSDFPLRGAAVTRREQVLALSERFYRACGMRPGRFICTIVRLRNPAKVTQRDMASTTICTFGKEAPSRA